MTHIRASLDKPTLQEAVSSLLYGTVDFLSQPDHPRGCLSIQGALACSDDAEPVEQAMIAMCKGGDDALRKRMTVARESGELPEDTDPADYARFLSTVIRGLGVQTADGATREEMKRVADFVLRAIRMAWRRQNAIQMTYESPCRIPAANGPGTVKTAVVSEVLPPSSESTVSEQVEPCKGIQDSARNPLV